MKNILSLLITSLMLIALTGMTNYDSEILQDKSLADEVVGIYKGKAQNKSVQEVEYKIKVTKIDNKTIKIQPLEGKKTQTFEATLQVVMMGSIRTVQLRVKGDKMPNNGTYMDRNQLLSYNIHLGGEDDRNIEVFVGTIEK